MSAESAYPKSVHAGIPKLAATPRGWRRLPIGTYLKEVKRPVALDDTATYDLVTVKRSRGGVEKRETLRGSQILVKSQFRVEGGDFLISKRQIVHGACGLVPADLAGSIVSGEYAVLHSTGDIDLKFLKYLSETLYFQQTCFHSSIGVHVEKMIFSVDQWFRWLFDLPTLLEQERIARALSCWDSAVACANQLIENLDLQHTVMSSQLLSGARRLKGHHAKWTGRMLGRLGSTYGGLTGKIGDDFGAGEPFVPFTNVFGNPRTDIHALAAVRLRPDERQNVVKFGDIFFTGSSETPDELAMSSVLLDRIEGVYLNSFCIGYRLNDFKQLSPEYAQFLFRGPEFRRELRALAQGATRYNLSRTELMRVEVPLPPLKEQLAISKALTASASAVRTARAMQNCLIQERKSLGQQLLTGRRRLRAKS